MTQILSFVATYMGFLWNSGRFRITGSEVTTSNGGDALMVVESPVMRMRFVQDRGQLLLDFQPTTTEATREWFSIDLMRRLMEGTPEVSGVMDRGYALFLQENIDVVEGRFRPEEWPETRRRLRELKVQRSRELFG